MLGNFCSRSGKLKLLKIESSDVQCYYQGIMYFAGIIKRDLQLANKANCTATDINNFVNAFQGLMTKCTEAKFDLAWFSLKSEERFHSNDVVLTYFENNLLPAFKIHSSIWVLKSAGVLIPIIE